MEEMTGVYRKNGISNSACLCGLDTAGSNCVLLTLYCKRVVTFYGTSGIKNMRIFPRLAKQTIISKSKLTAYN